jgi:hypothetical protein
LQIIFQLGKTISISVLLVFIVSVAASQPARFSFATDLGLQRSFKKTQRYTAIGHTVHGHLHFTAKQGAYASFVYFSAGRFRNQLVASAKSSTTIPQQVVYQNNAEMRFKQFSVGWKQYLKGGYNITQGWSIYGFAGFGLMLGRVTNTHSTVIDTSQYNLPVLSGKTNFKRLTLDLSLGWEAPIGADIFFYTEARAFVPTTDYPSNHLFVNENAPFAAAAVAGIRIIF